MSRDDEIIRELATSVSELLELYRSVHPAEALLNDRLDRYRDCGCRDRTHQSCGCCSGHGQPHHRCFEACRNSHQSDGGEDCEPGRRKGPEPGDGHGPRPGTGDHDPRSGYSRKSRGYAEAMPIEDEHARWKQVVKIPHEGERPVPVPLGAFVGLITPSDATGEVRDYRDGPSGGGAQEPVSFRRFTDGTITTSWWPPDMSGAKAGDVVLMSGNLWLKLSVDGGQTFIDLDFTKLFAADATYGGWGCDQVVRYVPAIDCFVLYVQAFRNKTAGDPKFDKNAVKIALASPADLKKYKGGKPAWNRRWTFSSDTFGLGNVWMDFPDLTSGDSFLYVNTNTFATDSTVKPPAETYRGKLFFELPLADLAAGRSLNFLFGYIADPAVFGGSPAQNIGQENYWAGHVSNSTIRLYSSKGTEADYFWRDRTLSNWPMTGDIVSAAPDSPDWIGADHRIMGATLVGNQVWFAWSAGSGDGGHGGFSFPQAHVQIAKFDLGQDFKLIEQTQVWNPSTAFAYPSLTTNSDNEVGISLAWGGGPDFGSHAVGILGDFVVWFGEESLRTGGLTTPALDKAGNPILNADGTAKLTTIVRWGDYVHVRLAYPDTRFFSAFGYSVIADPNTSSNASKPLYVEFGRERVVQRPPR